MTAPAAARGIVSVGMAKNGASPANGPGMARHRKRIRKPEGMFLDQNARDEGCAADGINEAAWPRRSPVQVRMPREEHHDDADHVRNGKEQAGLQAGEIVAAAPESFREETCCSHRTRSCKGKQTASMTKTTGRRRARPTGIFFAGLQFQSFALQGGFQKVPFLA